MYKLTQHPGVVLRASDNASIPADPANRDYADYLAWVAAGNAPEPYTAPAPAPGVPQVVSKFQAKAALHGAGLLESVDGLMLSPNTPTLAKLAWADAQEFRRTSPTVAAMAQALGLDDAALDALFTAAAAIEA